MGAQKTLKGSVSVNVKDDWLRLRWRHSGKRYELRPGLVDNRQNRVFADRLARSIEIDLLSGHFDPTLEKYKGGQKAPEPQAPQKVKSIIELYEEWLKHLTGNGTGAKTLSTMRSLLSNFEHYHNPSQFIQWLGTNNKAITVKRKLDWLSRCYEYHTLENPWQEIKVKVPAKPMPTPFSDVEVQKILNSCKEIARHYYDFLYFCFAVGARLGETAALKWSEVSEDCSRVVICDQKRNKIRQFKLPDSVVEMLKRRERSEDFVFTSAEGHKIALNNFRNRYWIPILTKANVDYRKPYTTRATCISHALLAGENPMRIAQITGHDVAVLYENYAGYIESSPKLPDVFAKSLESSEGVAQ
jgi:integrase